MPEDQLRFVDLWDRHIGVTEGIAKSYAEAACVCLDRHHTSPQALHIHEAKGAHRVAAEWTAPDGRTKRAWANTTDATEAGAYALALAAVESTRGLVAVRRAETLTGADYYLASATQTLDSLEAAFRLEVSGMSEGDESRMGQRLRQKIRQAASGRSNLPAIALVVGFEALKIFVAEVERK